MESFRLGRGFVDFLLCDCKELADAVEERMQVKADERALDGWMKGPQGGLRLARTDDDPVYDDREMPHKAMGTWVVLWRRHANAVVHELERQLAERPWLATDLGYPEMVWWTEAYPEEPIFERG